MVPLPQGKGLVPGVEKLGGGHVSQPLLRGWEGRNAPDADFESPEERRRHIDRASAAFAGITSRCARLSSAPGAAVAHVEAELWAGSGGQAAAVWEGESWCSGRSSKTTPSTRRSRGSASNRGSPASPSSPSISVVSARPRAGSTSSNRRHGVHPAGRDQLLPRLSAEATSAPTARFECEEHDQERAGGASSPSPARARARSLTSSAPPSRTSRPRGRGSAAPLRRSGCRRRARWIGTPSR